MPVERSHDRPYPGAPRADELPPGVPSQAEPASPSDFDERGKFARGNAIARKGGKALAGKSRLASRLTLADGSDASSQGHGSTPSQGDGARKAERTTEAEGASKRLRRPRVEVAVSNNPGIEIFAG
jgi:hypothetical protein